jgi:predicted ATPase with chaperone activity
MEPNRACGRAPRCGLDYQGKLSGPLLDRIDLCIDVPPVNSADLALPPPAESSADVAARVAAARTVQRERLAAFDREGRLLSIEPDPAAGLLSERASGWLKPRCNADADGALLAAIAEPDAEGRALLTRAAERLGLSASHAPRRPHACRSRRLRRGAPPAHCRSAVLPTPAAASGDGGVINRATLVTPGRGLQWMNN